MKSNLNEWAEQKYGKYANLVIIGGNELFAPEFQRPSSCWAFRTFKNMTEGRMPFHARTTAVYICRTAAQHDADIAPMMADDVEYEDVAMMPFGFKIQRWLRERCVDGSTRQLVVMPSKRFTDDVRKRASAFTKVFWLLEQPNNKLELPPEVPSMQWDDILVCDGTTPELRAAVEEVGERVWDENQSAPRVKGLVARTCDAILNGIRVPEPLITADDQLKIATISTTIDAQKDHACLAALQSAMEKKEAKFALSIYHPTIPIIIMTCQTSLALTHPTQTDIVIRFVLAQDEPNAIAWQDFARELPTLPPLERIRCAVELHSNHRSNTNKTIGTVAPGQDIPFGTPVAIGEDGLARTVQVEFSTPPANIPPSPSETPPSDSRGLVEVKERGWWKPTDGGLADRLVKVLESSMAKPYERGDSRIRMIASDVLTELRNGPCDLPSAEEIAACWHGTPYVKGIEGSEHQGTLLRSWLHLWLSPILTALRGRITELEANQESAREILFSLPTTNEFDEALQLAALMLPYDKRRAYDFDNRFAKLCARHDEIRKAERGTTRAELAEHLIKSIVEDAEPAKGKEKGVEEGEKLPKEPHPQPTPSTTSPIPLPTLYHVHDLEAFDGPLLSEYRSDAGNVYVEKWCDVVEKEGVKVGHRWLLVRVNSHAIADYVAKKITMLELLVGASDDVGFLVDRVVRVDAVSKDPTIDQVVTKVEGVQAVRVSSLPTSYLPHPTARHDDSLRPEHVLGAE